MKKRIIAMILCIVMVISMLPVTVFAAEADNLHHFTKRNDYTSGTFDDVQKDDWFYKNVKSVYELGLMQGKGGKQFDPESSVTIAETLTIAARLHSIYYTGSDAFTASNPWYQVYVDYCAANGIASVDSGAYSQPASRAEFVMILANALPAEVFGEVNQVADNAIPDVHINDSYGAAVYKMYRAGIMIGNDDIGTFAPDSEIKRSEVAAIVTRMVDASLRESIQLGKEYIVTFNMNGHGKQVDPQAVVEGYTAEKPADPTNASYAFKGWYTQKSGGQQFDFNTPITEDITLYARWELNSGWTGDPGWDDDYIPTYTVTFDANGSDVENLPEVQRVKAGECAVEPDEPTKLIHDFGGWYTDSSCTNPFDFSTPITSNITLYAKWNITIYAKPIDESHVKTGVLECDGEEYEGMYIDNQLIVVSREGVGLEEIEALADLYGGHVVGQNSSVGMYQVEFAKTRTKEELEALAEDFLRGPVESAYLHRVYEMQNDAYYPNDLQDRYAEAPDAYENYEYCWNTFLWGHDACYVPEAWEVVLAETENPSVVMGLIDDSFDARHEDLNFFRCFMHKDQYNPFEVAASNPAAAEHGTHVAGIMGAVTNNGRGISGVALNASLIGVSVRDRDGDEGYLMGAMSWNNDIALLIENGAKVINISLGMKQTAINNVSVWLNAKAMALDLKLELDRYYKQGKGFLIVTSSGNDGQYDGHDTNYNNAFCNISEEYLKDRIIVVGNAARLGSEYVRSESSSYLGGRVDVMAPGTGIGGGIYSTLPNNRYGGTKLNGGLLIGTSMAAPFVAGLAGLIWEANPNLTPERVKEIIVSTANIDVADSDANMVNAEAAVIEALGYDPRTKDITFSFVDTSTDSAIKARLVSWKGVEYSPKYEFHPELDLNDLKLTYWVMNGDENSTISTVPYTVPYGEFKFEFEAPGYQKTTVAFSADDNTDVITINLTPEGVVIPPVEPGFNITGTFVYWNDANKEIPVSFAKCMLTDVTNSNIIYFAEVADGKLSNESFSTKPPAGTYLFELEGGDVDDNGFYSHKVIENVVITGDLDLGKIYCDRVASVSCAVANEDNEYLNNVGMTITQNGKTVMKIDRFYHGFDVALKEGLYTLTLTCEGYSSYTRDFAVKGTTDLGTIILSLDNGFAGGDGSETNPYKVSTPEQLNAVRNDLAAHYIQTNDIDMSEYGNFTPIGIGMPSYSTTLLNPVEFDPRPFTGTYDGGGYKIIGLTINENTLDCVGLFSGCDENSIVKNVNLVNASLSINKIGTDYTEQWETGNIFSISAGLISGYSSGSIINCHVSGSINVINCNDAAVGGIVGWGNVNSCTNKANIYVLSNKDSRYVDDGDVKCGGIIGGSNAINGATNNCINYGNVTVISGNSAKVGGISGSDGALTYCVNYGNIKAIVNYPNGYSSTYETASVGGIFGSSSSNNTTYCINLGLVEASIYDDRDRYTNQAYVGGIGGHSGFYESGIVTNCYNGGTNIIAVKYIDDSEGSYTEVAGNANRVIGALGGSLDENKNNYSLSTTLTNGKIASDQIGDTKINGETITQEAFDEKLEEVLSVITN